MMGQRLKKMFPNAAAPEHIYFMNDDLLNKWRREDMNGKFSVIEDWIGETGIQVLFTDTANDFFRGGDSTSEEAVVGGFFDKLRGLKFDGRILVRHNRKRRDGEEALNPNEMIRGSGEWKEDPEVIIHLDRVDRRTHEVELAVGKLRYGAKPDPCKLWFDSDCFRLTPLPPVVAALECGLMTRQALIAACERLGLKDRKVDEHLATMKGYLSETKLGHEKAFSIDAIGSKGANWFSLLNGTSGTVEDKET